MKNQAANCIKTRNAPKSKLTNKLLSIFITTFLFSIACKKTLSQTNIFSNDRSSQESNEKLSHVLPIKEVSLSNRRTTGFVAKICDVSPWKATETQAQQSPDCVQVEEDIYLNTQWIRESNTNTSTVKKPLILFLHGGPGGTLNDYADLGIFQKLKERYDILMFTQRGSGLSTPLKDKKDLSRFTLHNHLEDIDALINLFSNSKQVVLMGHSYGAHLALIYASQKSEKIQKLIVLNGAADGSGFVQQSTIRMNLFEQILRENLNKKELTALEKKENEGTLTNETGEKISGLFNEYHQMIYSYKGLSEDLPKKLKQVANTNLAQLTNLQLVDDSAGKNSKVATQPKNGFVSFRDGFAPAKSTSYLARFDLSNSAEDQTNSFNDILNQWIVCTNLITPQAVEKVSVAYRDLPSYRRKERCKTYGAQVQTFDVNNELAKISAKVLLTSGTHDPLIPWVLQKDVHSRLRKAKKDSTWVAFEKAGHNPDEDPKCLQNTILSFLEDSIAAGEYLCKDGEISGQK